MSTLRVDDALLQDVRVILSPDHDEDAGEWTGCDKGYTHAQHVGHIISGVGFISDADAKTGTDPRVIRAREHWASITSRIRPEDACSCPPRES